MIFFMIDNNNRNLDTIFSNEPVSINEDDIRLIAWNDIPQLSTYEKLKSAVTEEWTKDTSCMDIINQAALSYGFDLTLEKCGLNGYFDKNSVLEMINKIFFNWAHPMVGNTANSRIQTPFDLKKEYVWDWHTSNLVVSSEETIKRALEEMGPLNISGMEQVRICSNLKELARALVGEITTQISQDIEKLFALQLSQSEELLKIQVEMLQALLEKYKDVILQAVTLGKSKLESIQYLIPKTKFIKPEKMASLLEEFINMAVDKQYISSYTDSYSECVDIWKKIPQTIRCSVLMKDFSKVLGRFEIPEKISLGSIIKDNFKGYTMIEAINPRKYIPEFIGKGYGSKLSWNRDEYHDSTKTYRHFLCPLWDGGTEQTATVIAFWKNILGDKLPDNGILAIAGGLFTLGNLYCDKYKFSDHTLVETFEATCAKEISQLDKASIAVNPQKLLSNFDQLQDVFQILKASRINDWSIDPIALSRLIKKVYFDVPMKSGNCNFSETYAKVQASINEERIKIKDILGFALPEWCGPVVQSVQQKVFKYAAALTGTKKTTLGQLRISNQAMRNAVHS